MLDHEFKHIIKKQFLSIFEKSFKILNFKRIYNSEQCDNRCDYDFIKNLFNLTNLMLFARLINNYFNHIFDVRDNVITKIKVYFRNHFYATIAGHLNNYFRVVFY